MFDAIRIQDDDVRSWFQRVLQAKTRDLQQQGEKDVSELNRQLTSLRNQMDRSLNLRLLDEIDEDTFARKNIELRDRIAETSTLIETKDRSQAERGEIAMKVFELSQTLKEKWLEADYRAKRRLLDIV